jgi:hypothetical protein
MAGYPWAKVITLGDPNNPPFSASDVSDYCAVYAESLRQAAGDTP